MAPPHHPCIDVGLVKMFYSYSIIYYTLKHILFHHLRCLCNPLLAIYVRIHEKHFNHFNMKISQEALKVHF